MTRTAMDAQAGPVAWLAAPDFDLHLTLDSGQVFHWLPAEGGYRGVIGEQPVWVLQQDGGLLVSAGSEALVHDYFAIDDPMQEIYQSFPDDVAMREALEFCRGMRVIRQPVWECLATFITSSMKQVAHIAQMSHAIRRRFGRRVGAWEAYAYPPPERLAQAGEEELRACGLGYRAKNLIATARRVAEGRASLEAIRGMGDDEARDALCELPGVGVKVANCVLLFGYRRLGAFPIDVWIERVLRTNYFRRKRNVTPARLRAFAAEHFGQYGGYAQQYLFHHARKTTTRKRRPEGCVRMMKKGGCG